jgi:hypothetical protein
MPPLILKRASASRSSGQWRDDDFDVLEEWRYRRPHLSSGAMQDRPWMWASGHNGEIRRAAHGYELTREAAMAVFAAGDEVTGSFGGSSNKFCSAFRSAGRSAASRAGVWLCAAFVNALDHVAIEAAVAGRASPRANM